jgi:hypothetical protein
VNISVSLQPANGKNESAKYLMQQPSFLKLRALAPAGTTDIAES